MNMKKIDWAITYPEAFFPSHAYRFNQLISSASLGVTTTLPKGNLNFDSNGEKWRDRTIYWWTCYFCVVLHLMIHSCTRTLLGIKFIRRNRQKSPRRHYCHTFSYTFTFYSRIHAVPPMEHREWMLHKIRCFSMFSALAGCTMVFALH